MRNMLLIASVLLGNPSTAYIDTEIHYVGSQSFPFIGVTASTVLGPAAPAIDQCGIGFGLLYAAPANESFHAMPGLPCWTGSDNVVLRIFLTNTEDDIVQDGETIIFNFEYRTVGPTAGTAIAGNTVTAVLTYEQDGASANCAQFIAEVTLDRSDGDQPYVAFDSIIGTLSVDAASTYSGDPIVTGIVFLIPFDETCHIG